MENTVITYYNWEVGRGGEKGRAAVGRWSEQFSCSIELRNWKMVALDRDRWRKILEEIRTQK